MISVVIPTHRRVDLLHRLLDSIQRQTFSDYEVIVVDDASPNVDDYERLVSEWRKRFPRFEYVRMAQNGGAPRARNAGIARAAGDWVALVDDDDEWLPQKLELQYEVARSATDRVGLIYTWTRAVDGAGITLYDSRPTIEGDATREIFTTNFVMSPSVMVRRDVFERVGGFDEELPSCQDWDMWARVLCGGYECRVVREEVSIYYRHGQASIGLSPRALYGYRMFLNKHWRSILRHTGPLNWVKKALLHTKTIVARA